MFCEKCGAQLRDDAKFCSSCGSKVEESDVNSAATPEPVHISAGEAKESFQGSLSKSRTVTASPVLNQPEISKPDTGEEPEEEASSEEMVWYEDASLPRGMLKSPRGDIMWNYSLDMVKNPFILHVFYKLFLSCGFGFGLIIAFAFGSAMDAFDEAVGVFFLIFLGFGGGLSVLATLVYFLHMSIGGSIYRVMHIMTKDCIQYSLLGSESDEKSRKKARQMMSVVNFLSNGISSSGLAIETNTYMVSDYKEVRKITAEREKNLIRLKHNVLQNRIYADSNQYDFVLNYLKSHCTNAQMS